MASSKVTIDVWNIEFVESYLKDMDEAVTALQAAATKEELIKAQNRVVHAQEKMRMKKQMQQDII